MNRPQNLESCSTGLKKNISMRFYSAWCSVNIGDNGAGLKFPEEITPTLRDSYTRRRSGDFFLSPVKASVWWNSENVAQICVFCKTSRQVRCRDKAATGLDLVSGKDGCVIQINRQKEKRKMRAGGPGLTAHRPERSNHTSHLRCEKQRTFFPCKNFQSHDNSQKISNNRK